MRSGRIRREAVPLAAAAYRVRLTDATSLAATFTAETGIRRYSSLAWYDAPSPMPDYYRWMPGYQTDPVTRLEMENIWRANDVRYTQIDWDEFYRQNRNSKDGSATYLMEDRVERIANIQLLAEGVTRINERLTVRYGIRAARMDSRFYKQMRDLMGRNYFVDRDYYLIETASMATSSRTTCVIPTGSSARAIASATTTTCGVMKSAPEVHSNTVPTACGLLSQPRSEPAPYSAGDTTKKSFSPAINPSENRGRCISRPTCSAPRQATPSRYGIIWK